MSDTLVSILTPAYNHEKYIAQCIESVISQTYTNWEMIIVDDGSTDNTFRIATEYALKDNRIKVFTQQNTGIYHLAVNYNFAISVSQGKYIAVLEGDDVWLPEKLMLQINALEINPDAVLSWGRAYASDALLKNIVYNLPVYKYNRDTFFNDPVGSVFKIFLFTNHIPALTVVIRKSVIQEIGGFIQPQGMPTTDFPTWQQLAFRGKFIFIDEFLGHWRITNTQVTKNLTVNLIEQVYELNLKLFLDNKKLMSRYQLSESQVHHYFHERLIVNFYYEGCYQLQRGEVIKAKQSFGNSLKSYGFVKPVWKFRSFLKLVKIYFKIN
jgi:glycosyltransferase involved in cell wall biosynthesis